MISERGRIVLMAPVPEKGLEIDVGTVIHISHDGEAFEVEFTAPSNSSITSGSRVRYTIGIAKYASAMTPAISVQRRAMLPEYRPQAAGLQNAD